MLENEDNELPYLLKINFAFCKLLKTEDLKIQVKIVKKRNTTMCLEGILYHHCAQPWKHTH